MAYPRSRKSNGEHLIDGLIALPWWCSLIFGLIIWGAASLFASYYPKHILVVMLQPSWPVLPAVVGFTALASALKARRSTKSLQKIKTLQDIKDVPWQEFEHLTVAYYRERSYHVDHTGKAGPDGGIDLDMRKDRKRILVQCKRYNGRSIGVQAVREFFGVVISQGADKGIFITTSDFTPEAMTFGLSQASLELIPGNRFAQMVHHLRTETPAHQDMSWEISTDTPAQAYTHAGPVTIPFCPSCGERMVERQARRGSNIGGMFWGCSQYPNCRGMRPGSLTK